MHRLGWKGAMSEQIRMSVLFSGAVQGVGFRFTARRLATGATEVAGFVRNLPDGRVELVAEGAREEAQRLLDALEEAMRGCIADREVEWGPPTGEFSAFDIRF